jgi:DNA-binding MarR family transcriptional regulator
LIVLISVSCYIHIDLPSWEFFMPPNSVNALVSVFHDLIVGLCRHDSADLTARHLAVFLACYLSTEGQTVRGLAAYLNVSKPAITRALDKLEKQNLMRRKTDPNDRRSIFATRTMRGAAYLTEIKRLLATASTDNGVALDPGNVSQLGPSGRIHL